MIAILGAGESGVGAAILAVKKGYDVFVSDFGEILSGYKSILEDLGISYEEKGHNLEKILTAELIIKSPGISSDISLIKSIVNEGIPIISEIEWAYKFCKGKIIAITGSNGKTTVTNLVAHLLEKANKSVVKCGNVGFSFAKAVSELECEYYVVEVSSFQLEDINQFQADISILTNITADHLDRYNNNLTEYGLTKLKITENQNKKQILILGNIDEWTKKLIKNKKINAKVVLTDHERNSALELNKHIIKYDNMFLKGKHNAANVACAVSVMDYLEIDVKIVEEGLNDFINDPHRMEWIRDRNGVTWVNDSKATNVDAVYFALEAQSKPIVWIAGGKDKGNDYTLIDDLVRSKVKGIVCLGVDNSMLLDHFGLFKTKIRDTHKISDAVKEAEEMAERGDVVLLSPACASFDLFDNYKQRGVKFREEVKKLE